MQTRANKSEDFIEFLADECSGAIIVATSRKECSAMQLSRELSMPISTVYKKLKLLEDAEIIQNVKTLIDRAGNQEKYYRCIVRDAVVKFHEGEISISIEKADYKNDFVTLWKNLANPKGKRSVNRAEINAELDTSIFSQGTSL